MWVDVYVWGKGVIDIFGYHDDRNLLSMVNENVSHRCMYVTRLYISFVDELT